MNRELTFFVTEPIEELTVGAIAEEALRRGYTTRFEHRMDAEADLGLYVSHVNMIPEVRSTFSAIMLHDLGQHHVVWPHFWQAEPWDRFDVGLLPGPAWREMYEAESLLPGFHGPRLGAFEVGWPKADRLVTGEAALRAEVASHRERLGIQAGPSVLYAPSFENDGKQDDVVQACRDLDCNLLIKQAPWPDSHPEMVANIEEMANAHRGRHPRLHILDSRMDIMSALAMADVLVTDESCVMFEALLFGVPSISVQDWVVPIKTDRRRVRARHDFSVLSTRAQLREHIRILLEQGFHAPGLGKSNTLMGYRDRWFSRRGRAAVATMDLLEWMSGSSPVTSPLHRLFRQQDELKQQVTQLQTWRMEVERSLSWRMTRPLRQWANRVGAVPSGRPSAGGTAR
jgi:hypothetical protein